MKTAVLCLGCIALAAAAASEARSQESSQPPVHSDASQLPPIEVNEPARKPRRTRNAAGTQADPAAGECQRNRERGEETDHFTNPVRGDRF